MGKLIILLLIFLAGLFRWLILRGANKKASYTLISLFVQTLPFGFGKAFHTFLQGRLTEDDKVLRLGEFGNHLKIETPTFFIIIFVLIGYYKIRKNAFSIKNNYWFLILVSFSILSILNPLNTFPTSILALLFPIIQLIILFKLIEGNFKRQEILEGIYDGLMITIILQFVLAICYPVLGLDFVAGLFRGENAMEWSQRRGVASAIGTFGHPGQLALYSLIISIFFVVCFLNKFKHKTSLYLSIISLVTLILTFSRTTLICLAIILPILKLIHSKGSKVFTFKYIMYFICICLIIFIGIYISPIGSLFFESDSNVQMTNRFVHWSLGYQMWERSKLIGIGINTHIYYMLNKLTVNILADITLNDTLFFLRSPIHNIHVIVAAEAGLIGLTFWWYFFVKKIKNLYKVCSTMNKTNNIFNLTTIGMLLAIFTYGFFGWAPFALEIYSLCMLLGYFSTDNSSQLN